MKQLLVSNSSGNAVVIADLGAISIPDSTVDLELNKDFSFEQLRDSTDLRAAVVAGSLTAKLQPDNYTIDNDITFDKAMSDFVGASVEKISAVAGRIDTHSVGTRKATLDQDLMRTGGSTTNESAFILPFNATLDSISLASKAGENRNYSVAVIKNDVELYVKTITAGNGGVFYPTAIVASAGDKIRYRVKSVSPDVNKLEVTANWKEIF
jgi:hypothetical protein